jgi:hypothetical protein
MYACTAIDLSALSSNSTRLAAPMSSVMPPLAPEAVSALLAELTAEARPLIPLLGGNARALEYLCAVSRHGYQLARAWTELCERVANKWNVKGLNSPQG